MGSIPRGLRELAARVAGGAELLDVRMVKTSAEHLGFPIAGQPLEYDLDVNPMAHFNSETNALIVSTDFSLAVNQEVESDIGETETADIASVTFTLVALYDTPEGMTYGPEELESFGATTGVFSLYPYAREYVQDVTGRLGLPPLTLGVYRVPVPDQD